MPRTARDLIKDAGVTAGIISPKQTFNGTEVADALRQLNNILETMNLDKNFPPNKFVENASVNNNLISISLDSGSDIQIRRPNIITSVSYILGNVEYPLVYVSQDDYDQSEKSNTDIGYPIYYTTRTENTELVIEMYPRKSGSLDVVVTGENSLGEWTLDTEIVLPDGYYPFLEYRLAEILALRYGNVSYEMIKAQAQEYENKVKRINNKGRKVSKRGSIQSAGKYDIYSDRYRGRL